MTKSEDSDDDFDNNDVIGNEGQNKIDIKSYLSSYKWLYKSLNEMREKIKNSNENDTLTLNEHYDENEVLIQMLFDYFPYVPLYCPAFTTNKASNG